MNLTPQSDPLFPRHRRALAALLAAGGCGLAACGGSGSHATKTAQAAATAATTNAAQTLPVTVTAKTSRPGARHAAVAKRSAPADPPKTDSTTATSGRSTADPSTSTTTSADKTARRRKHVSPPPTWSPPKPSPWSHKVLACLDHAALGHVSVGSTDLWSGYDVKTGTFVYVFRYPNTAAAIARARFLSAEEVAHAGPFLIQQPIAPYRGSPVAPVTVCLGGKPPKPPAQKPGAFTF